MKLSIPSSLKTEHDELHQKLKEAIFLPGQTGVVAREVDGLLQPHFEKEEKYALPYLSLLPLLASGQWPDDMDFLIDRLDQFKKEWPGMLKEHQQVKAALQKLKKAAKEEQHPGVSDLADKLLLHAATEEEVTYPAVLLVGAYLSQKPQSIPVSAGYYP